MCDLSGGVYLARSWGPLPTARTSLSDVWVTFLGSDPPGSANPPSTGLQPGWHLGCKLFSDQKPELPSSLTPEFLTYKNYEVIKVHHHVKPLSVEIPLQWITNTERDAGAPRGPQGASPQVWPAFLWWTTGLSLLPTNLTLLPRVSFTTAQRGTEKWCVCFCHYDHRYILWTLCILWTLYIHAMAFPTHATIIVLQVIQLLQEICFPAPSPTPHPHKKNWSLTTGSPQNPMGPPSKVKTMTPWAWVVPSSHTVKCYGLHFSHQP